MIRLLTLTRFDVDAVNNVECNTLTTPSRYKVGESERSIEHQEAWSDDLTTTRTPRVLNCRLITKKLRLSLLYSFMRKLSIRSGVEPTITNSLNDRSTEKKNGERMANYLCSGSWWVKYQTVIADIIQENIQSKYWWFDVYHGWAQASLQDLQRRYAQGGQEKYTRSSISQLLMLSCSSKDSITPGLLWNLYTDDGQYMEREKISLPRCYRCTFAGSY